MSAQTSLTLDRRESSVFRVWEGGRLHDNQGRTTQAREPQWWEVMEAQKTVETKPPYKLESCEHRYAFIRNNGSAICSDCKRTVKFFDYMMSTDTSPAGIMKQLQKRPDS